MHVVCKVKIIFKVCSWCCTHSPVTVFLQQQKQISAARSSNKSRGMPMPRTRPRTRSSSLSFFWSLSVMGRTKSWWICSFKSSLQRHKMFLFHRWFSINPPTSAWIPHTVIQDIFIGLAVIIWITITCRLDPHLIHRTESHPHQWCRYKHTCSLRRYWHKGQVEHIQPPWPHTHPDL